jgi:hypothetical protein
MELFTMGEGQGYTESDIRELAGLLPVDDDARCDKDTEFKNDPNSTTTV